MQFHDEEHSKLATPTKSFRDEKHPSTYSIGVTTCESSTSICVFFLGAFRSKIS